MSTHEPGDLEHLIHPMKPEEFFGQHWNRQALYQPGPPEKFSGLFDRAAFLRGIGQCADLKVGYTDENGWPAHFQIQPGQAESMLAAGKTVCAAGIEQNDERLTAFLARIQTRFGVAGRFFFNCYLSPDGAGFDLHLDDHPVCILQIEGQKRWWYSPEPALPAVLSNISFPKNRQTLQLPWVTVTRPRPEELAEVVLSPGDLLYLPKGSWHRAQAIGESLALTLAMQSVSPLDLLQNALGPKLDNAVFRSALPGYWAGEPDNGIPVALEAAFETALTELRALLNSTTAAELYTLWSRAAAAASQRKGPAA